MACSVTTGYKLGCELGGDVSVRGICLLYEDGIATSHGDGSIKVWTLDPTLRKYICCRTLSGQSPLAWIPPSVPYLLGRLVSASMESDVLVWDLATGEKIHKLIGHQKRVTGLCVDHEDIISSSLDQTLKRWRNGQIHESWEAHQPIHAVIQLASGELVSGASDGTITLWKGNTKLQSFTKHTDTVTAFAEIPGVGWLSSSHDWATLLWDLKGNVLHRMGHTASVFSVDANANALIISSSEDCDAKIWKDGACVQSLEHPGYVWDAKILKSGDIVTACSDGTVRIWTEKEERISESIDTYGYKTKVLESRQSRSSGMELNVVPWRRSLKLQSGTCDGQVNIVREGDMYVAFAWRMKEERWHALGDVVGWKVPVTECPNQVEHEFGVKTLLADMSAISKQISDMEKQMKSLKPMESQVDLVISAAKKGLDSLYSDLHKLSEKIPGIISATAALGVPISENPSKVNWTLEMLGELERVMNLLLAGKTSEKLSHSEACSEMRKKYPQVTKGSIKYGVKRVRDIVQARRGAAT